MDTEQNFRSEISIKDGNDVARYLLYFARVKDLSDGNEINIASISGKMFYKKHRVAFDKCIFLQDKYGINLVKYLKFFANSFGVNDLSVKRIVDPTVISMYAENLQIAAKHERVYGYVMKSIDNIVEECIRENFSSTREYFKHLVSSNRLGEKFLTGKISQYYLAGIKNFPKIVLAMDSIGRDTFEELVKNRDKILSDMNDAFVHIKSVKPSIISLTDKKLLEQLSQLSKNSKNQ